MLVLNRKLGEDIRIGKDVIVVVLEVRNGQVKIGIDAPSEVTVHRGEVYERIRQGIARTPTDEVKKAFRPRRR